MREGLGQDGEAVVVGREGEGDGGEEETYTEDDEQFMAAIRRHRGQPEALFKLLEADGDGTLDLHELRRATERILSVIVLMAMFIGTEPLASRADGV
jgi:hypothetical protein